MSGRVSDVAALFGAIAALVAAVGGVWAAFLGVREYRLKSEAQRVEIDVQLSKLLAELVPVANGWGAVTISDVAIEAIASRSSPDATPAEIGEALSSAAVSAPVDEAAQAVAVASIGYLGSEHRTLREPSYQALRTLRFAESRPVLIAARDAAIARIEALQNSP